MSGLVSFIAVFDFVLELSRHGIFENHQTRLPVHVTKALPSSCPSMIFPSQKKTPHSLILYSLQAESHIYVGKSIEPNFARPPPSPSSLPPSSYVQQLLLNGITPPLTTQ